MLNDRPIDEYQQLVKALVGILWIARRLDQLEADGISRDDALAWIEADAASALGDHTRKLKVENPELAATLEEQREKVWEQVKQEMGIGPT